MSSYIKKILSGIIIGLIVNILGIVLYIFVMTNEEVGNGVRMAYRTGFLGKIIGLGALPNMILFSYFIKNNYLYQARGVVIATFLAALLTLYLL